MYKKTYLILKMEPIIISIDGNIGAGKTTFLQKIKETYPDFHYIDEPVEVWTQFVNEEGQSLLEVFYKDKTRWSYTFQNCAFMTRAMAITKAIQNWHKECKIDASKMKNNVFITERSVDTDFNVFAKMLHEDKSINKMEWDIYRQWYRYLSPDCKLAGIVYITCGVDKCKTRICTRNRTGEDNIPVPYLEQLHNYHETWINNTSIPVVRLESQKDLLLNPEYMNDNLALFDKFVRSLN